MNRILNAAGTPWVEQREGEKRKEHLIQRHITRDFPGGAVVKNPPANAGDTGSSPGPGRSHMSWSN